MSTRTTLRVRAIAAALLLLVSFGCEKRLDLGANDPASRDGTAGAEPDGGDDGGRDAGEDGGPDGEPVAIAVGGDSACAWRAERIACWGRADRGQLRVDPADAHATCGGAPCQDIVAHGTIEPGERIVLGGRHGCALSTSGALACWGDNSFGQLGRGVADGDAHATASVALEGVTDVALGRFHTCTLAAGRIRCWGLGEHGELGIDPATLEECLVSPALAAEARVSGTAARCATSPRASLGFEMPDALFAGGFATCTRTGDLAQCAGLDDMAQLGLAKRVPGATSVSPMPGDVAVGGVEALALGERHACALLGGGQARCWGASAGGALGVGSVAPADCGGTPCIREPTPVSDLSGVTAVAVGRAHSCALLADSHVRCSGSDANGQLGNSEMPVDTCATPDGEVPCAPRPVEVWDLDDAVALQAGDDHTCAVRADGEVVCWGDNSFSQIGGPNPDPVAVPTPIYNLWIE
jgi:alpha-tubulin suppressor-like RCC1 family protein